MAGNALMQRRAAPPQAPPDAQDPEAEMEQLMRQTGYQGSDPAEGMAHVWKAMPTDDVAGLIEVLSKKHGLPPPWEQSDASRLPPAEANAPREEVPPPRMPPSGPGNSMMMRR